jgi:hypothetical protein
VHTAVTAIPWAHTHLQKLVVAARPNLLHALHNILRSANLPSLTKLSLVIKGDTAHEDAFDTVLFDAANPGSTDGLAPDLASRLTSMTLSFENISAIYDMVHYVGRLGDAGRESILTVLWEGILVCACLYGRFLSRDTLDFDHHGNDCPQGGSEPPHERSSLRT